MTGFRALLGKELLESWRTLRLPLVAIVFLLVGLGSPLLARFTPQLIEAVAGDQITIVLPTPTAADSIDQLAKNLGQFGALVAILLAMGSVANEKERGTAAMLLTKPASRAAFLAAKLVTIGVVLGLAVAVATAGAWFYTLVLFEPLPIAGVAGWALLEWLVLMTWAAITLLGSTVTSSSVAAAGLGIVSLIAIGIAGVLPNVGRFLPTGLGGPARSLALGMDVSDLWTPVVATIVLIAASVALSWAVFRRQEL